MDPCFISLAIVPHFPHSWRRMTGQRKGFAMRILLAAVFGTVLGAATASSAMAEPKSVLKVDSATATIVNAHLVVTANGAVATGGWSNPRLHIHKTEGNFEIVQFQATPPVADAIVIQALVPVSATAIFPLPGGTITHVKIISETNAVTAPIAQGH